VPLKPFWRTALFPQYVDLWKERCMADLALVRNLAEQDHFFAVIAVARGDGTVHASVVKAGVLDDPEDGAPSVGLVVAGGARKLALLRRNGQATVVFRDVGRWVAVEGPARLEGPDDPAPAGTSRTVAAVIRDVYKAAGGIHDDWDQFDRAMLEERRCAVFVKADRITGNG
jgi:Pyridoxamine 5'-phosphate oxidase